MDTNVRKDPKYSYNNKNANHDSPKLSSPANNVRQNFYQNKHNIELIYKKKMLEDELKDLGFKKYFGDQYKMGTPYFGKVIYKKDKHLFLKGWIYNRVCPP